MGAPSSLHMQALSSGHARACLRHVELRLMYNENPLPRGHALQRAVLPLLAADMPALEQVVLSHVTDGEGGYRCVLKLPGSQNLYDLLPPEHPGWWQKLLRAVPADSCSKVEFRQRVQQALVAAGGEAAGHVQALRAAMAYEVVVARPAAGPAPQPRGLGAQLPGSAPALRPQAPTVQQAQQVLQQAGLQPQLSPSWSVKEAAEAAAFWEQGGVRWKGVVVNGAGKRVSVALSPRWS